MTLGEEQARRQVTLLIDNDLVCWGLAAMIARIPWLALPPADGDPPGPEAGCGCRDRVVIVSFDRWRQLRMDDSRARADREWIVVLGDESDYQDLGACVGLPFDGFLLASELSVRALDEALLGVVSGRMPIPPKIARQLLASTGRQRGAPASRTLLLTPREDETLRLLVRGMSNKQIARSLGISPHGAKRLVGSLLLKLGASNRTAAVVHAMNAGLVLD